MNKYYEIKVKNRTLTLEQINNFGNKEDEAYLELEAINKSMLSLETRIVFEKMKIKDIVMKKRKEKLEKKLKKFYNFNLYCASQLYDENSLVFSFSDGKKDFMSMHVSFIYKRKDITTSFTRINIDESANKEYHDLKLYKKYHLTSLPISKELKYTLKKEINHLIFYTKMYKEIKGCENERELYEFLYKSFNSMFESTGLRQIFYKYLVNINK